MHLSICCQILTGHSLLTKGTTIFQTPPEIGPQVVITSKLQNQP